MLTEKDLIIPFDTYEREEFIRTNMGKYPARIIELVTGIKITMTAKRIDRKPKPDTRQNSGAVLPEPARKAIVAIPVANGCTVITTPERAEKVKSKYSYLTDFKA